MKLVSIKLYWILFSTLLIFVLISTILPHPTKAISAADWKPGRILDDAIFFNKDAMNVGQIQSFLNSKVPICDTNHQAFFWSGGVYNAPPYTCLKDYSNSGKSAAQIIWEVGQAHGINPQVLIVMLQKESALITDTWAAPWQYKTAMGYGCPDTADCDSQYFGFTNQVNNAAWQLKRYTTNPDGYNFKAGVTRNIQWSPNGACGSSPVYIENSATAALYNYTPYQPNQAALNNLYGTGDGCSAYGNRNFWRLFNDWFGSSISSGFSLTRATAYADNGDPRQWLVYGDSRVLIPSPEIIEALNLETLPLTNYSGNYLGSIKLQNKPLSRLIRPEGTLDVYFADSGNKYRFPSVNVINSWGLSVDSIIDVPASIGTNLNNRGEVSSLVRMNSDERVMLMDGGVLRHLTNPNLLDVYGGTSPNIVSLSSTYFSSLQQGAAISTPKVSSGGSNYIADGGNMLRLDSNSEQIYPEWTVNNINIATFNNYNIQDAPILLKPISSPNVYLLDSRQKNHITTTSIHNSWKVALGNKPLYTSTDGLINMLPNGSAIVDYIASNSGNTYMIDKYKYNIPTNLNTEYRIANRQIYNISSSLLANMPSGGNLSKFVKSADSPAVYLVTNEGEISHIQSPDDLSLWGGGSSVVTISSENLEHLINNGKKMGVYVKDNTNSFIIQNATKSIVTNSIANRWNLTNPVILSDGTLDEMPLSDSLPLNGKLGIYFGIVDSGKFFATVDINIAKTWGINTQNNFNSSITNRLLVTEMLGRAAKSNLPNDNRQFIVDSGRLYHLSPEWAKNFSYNPAELTPVNPSTVIDQPISEWNSVVITNNSHEYYIIDNGAKRYIPEGVIKNFWINNNTDIKTVTDGFLNLYSNGKDMERAIRGTRPEIYAAEGGKKRWIRNSNTYVNYYAPTTVVSDLFITLMPFGNDIN